MHSKDRLGDIDTDCRNRLHSQLLRIVEASKGPSVHSRARGASIADIGTLGHFTFSTGGIAQVPSIAAFRGEYSRAWRENG